MFSAVLSLAILAGQVVNAAVNSPCQNSYVVVTVNLTTTVPNAAPMSTTPQISSQEVVFVTITDTTYVLPENTGFVGAPSSFYFPNISSTIAALVNTSSTTLAVEPITGTVLSTLESELHTLQSATEASSLTSLVSRALSTPPVKVAVQIITTVRPAYIYSLSGRPIYASPPSTITYTFFPPGASFRAAGPASGLSSTKPNSPASSIFPIVTSKPAPPAPSAVPPAPPVSSAKALSSSLDYPAGFSQGAHCPFPYPRESCAWNGQAATKAARSTMETKASEALKSTETGKCPYPGQKC